METNANYWDRVADHVSRRGKTGGAFMAGDDSPYNRLKASLVRLQIASMPVDGKRVLEVGSGPGGNLVALAERAAAIEGVDVSQRMAELARGAGGTVTVIDGESLPFGDNAFDIVFSCTVLQHNPDDRAQRLLAEMVRVAGEVVYLFEDIGGRGKVTDDYYLRPAEFYDAWTVTPLGTGATDRFHHGLMRLFARGHKEGEAIPRPVVALERLLLPAVRRVLDSRVTQRQGLATMTTRGERNWR